VSRVLLLNPPGRKNYIRDYFCSKVSKSYYKSEPATLLGLSGTIAARHEVAVLDAIVENLGVEGSLTRIERFRPEAVVSLVGAVSWEEDKAFLAQVKARTHAYLIAVGDILLEAAEERLAEAPAIDAALLNFMSQDVLALLSPNRERTVPNSVRRHPDGGFRRGEKTSLPREFSLPRPRHEFFPLRRYRFPFMVASPLAVVLTDYGCPFHCDFCVISGLGFGVRRLPEVLEELAFLRRQGVREIFFIDQTFGARRDRTLALCRAMVEQKWRFTWSCFSRADVTPPELLAEMARAGCHTIIYGVESGSDALLSRYHKQLELRKIRETFLACRRAGIRVAATFILGLPGETELQARATISLALSLPLDFAAFNVAVPRAGTRLRSQAVSEGLIDAGMKTMDQSGVAGAMGTHELSAERVLALRREANRRFYLRPGYWLRRLLTLRSAWDFKTQVREGWGLLQEALAGRREET